MKMFGDVSTVISLQKSFIIWVGDMMTPVDVQGAWSTYRTWVSETNSKQCFFPTTGNHNKTRFEFPEQQDHVYSMFINVLRIL